MSRSPSTRAVLLLVLLLAVAAPATAGDFTHYAPRGTWEISRVLGDIWHALVAVFAPSVVEPNGATAAGDCDRGSIMDPNGCPGATSQADTDRGSGMDPDG